MLEKDILSQVGVFLQLDTCIMYELHHCISVIILDLEPGFSVVANKNSAPVLGKCKLRNDKGREARSDLAKVGHCTSAQATMVEDW